MIPLLTLVSRFFCKQTSNKYHFYLCRGIFLLPIDCNSLPFFFFFLLFDLNVTCSCSCVCGVHRALLPLDAKHNSSSTTLAVSAGFINTTGFFLFSSYCFVQEQLNDKTLNHSCMRLIEYTNTLNSHVIVNQIKQIDDDLWKMVKHVGSCLSLILQQQSDKSHCCCSYRD